MATRLLDRRSVRSTTAGRPFHFGQTAVRLYTNTIVLHATRSCHQTGHYVIINTQYDAGGTLLNNQYWPIRCRPPTGIELRPLQAEHTDIVNNLWPNRHDGSAFLIRQLIERSPSIGAFIADDRSPDNGQLVAWCLQLQSGLHGALQVHPDHQRRGLGGLVCKAMAKLQAELGLDSSGSVFLDNYASMGMFEKAGFILLDHVSWMMCVATDPRAWLD